MANVKRLDWVDSARGIAIIAVFCGHFITPDRRLEIFCYSFHLQLFFLISGFFFKHNLTFKAFLLGQTKRLLIPLIFFGILNILLFDFFQNKTSSDLWGQFISIFTGFKNHPAGELWFLASLFTVSLTYYSLNKVVKNKHILLVAYLIVYLGGKLPTIKEFLSHFTFMNIHDIPNYLLFYALGDYIFSHLRNFQYDLQSSLNKRITHACGLILFFCAYAIFTFTPDWYITYGFNMPSPVVYDIYRLLLTLIIIGAVIYVSHLISEFKILSEIGKNTMILMGLEIIIKNISLNFMDMFSINIHLNNALQVVIYCLLLIFIVKLTSFKFFNKSVPFLIGRS
ncbi:acyltransferase family protein [Paenibacillus polymyxa]|uniref:acyltransferase family protein n=1 Tax=Paenibacillus polymyxa TaxID=1406 RepID=UPI002AB39127|nr:acyltransferase family protein [Paenibacillus polymyxa]MDY7989745.1 acyltransferase family protein [Paenibacillus polymyxa]MDY8116406.1 acyltransferase family protein [Paenibacillus polymyxa]